MRFTSSTNKPAMAAVTHSTGDAGLATYARSFAVSEDEPTSSSAQRIDVFWATAPAMGLTGGELDDHRSASTQQSYAIVKSPHLRRAGQETQLDILNQVLGVIGRQFATPSNHRRHARGPWDEGTLDLPGQVLGVIENGERPRPLEPGEATPPQLEDFARISTSFRNRRLTHYTAFLCNPRTAGGMRAVPRMRDAAIGERAASKERAASEERAAVEMTRASARARGDRRSRPRRGASTRRVVAKTPPTDRGTLSMRNYAMRERDFLRSG
ncbi:uncharacterized protein SCHCODRAFT_01106491 [Schizophyllum commune H4-8]|nr:uncharacterized protein SCHCODRAFT_01106491 [Schizophyllum commune H4-8]KAI5885883.1 hypothetical protein SCHCODRAFT_01106491 [Schizophyllum commune H4-8]